MDTDEETVLGIVLRRRCRRRRRRRRQRVLWMHPITADRLARGQFYTIMSELKEDNSKYFNYFRMSRSTFSDLLDVLKIHIEKVDTSMRRSIPAEERLAITLRYLATGCSFTELHYTFRCGISTCRKIVIEVCETIWRLLHEACFPQLMQEDWLKIADGFGTRANFPNCLGAIDGKHVRLIQPAKSGSTYFSYKKYFSMVLLALCDSNYRFLFVDVGSYGKSSDSAIYKNSELFQKMKDNTLNIPSDRPIVENGEPLPFTFVGDEAFALSTHMQRPYGGKNLTQKKKIFNYRLSRARRYIECTFGILTNKWRIFHRPLDVKIENAETIVKACCILHNFVRERDGVEFDSTLNVVGLDEGEPLTRPGNTRSALTIREKFSDYFSSEQGSVPWQYFLL